MSYDNDNVFAKILRGELPCAKVMEDDLAFAFMDIMPRAEGHVLVIPKAPARTLLDASADDLTACMLMAQKVARAAVTAFDADGFTLLQANEAGGGQEVFHLHFHILPRWQGVKLGRPAERMEAPDVLKANAAKIIAALSD